MIILLIIVITHNTSHNDNTTTNNNKHNNRDRQQKGVPAEFEVFWQASSTKTSSAGTANLRTNIMDVRGFDSSIILILRGGILMSIENSPGSLSHAILVGIMLVGRLGVLGDFQWRAPARRRARELLSRSLLSCGVQEGSL